MSIAGRLVTLFPAVHLGLCLTGLGFWISGGNAWWLCWILGALYLFPPLVSRVHQRLCPVTEGLHRLDTPGYSPWWGTLQFQAVFNAAPFLEGFLRIVPGCYSAWLRLWGSRIGRRVLWTPRVEVSDRAFLDVGDDVVFGHRVALYCHVVDRRRGKVVLYIKRIGIGSRSLIGAGSRIGPGAVIDEGACLAILTDVHIGKRIKAP